MLSGLKLHFASKLILDYNFFEYMCRKDEFKGQEDCKLQLVFDSLGEKVII